MHEGIQCDPIQGQGQGYEPFKVGNLAIFKSYLFHHISLQITTYTYTQVLFIQFTQVINNSSFDLLFTSLNFTKMAAATLSNK